MSPASAARWVDYPWQAPSPTATPWRLPRPDAYLEHALDPFNLLTPYTIVAPNSSEPNNVKLARFYLYERVAMFGGNWLTTSLVFLVLTPLFVCLAIIPINGVLLNSNVLIGFILVPPLYVLVRILIQRFLGDGTVVKTLQVLNAELDTGSNELVECQELAANVNFATQLLLTFFTNASILVSTVVDRSVLVGALIVSLILSYALFLHFFHARVDPASRVHLRIHLHWEKLCLKYNMIKLQHRMRHHTPTGYLIFKGFCGISRSLGHTTTTERFRRVMDAKFAKAFPRAVRNAKGEVMALEPPTDRDEDDNVNDMEAQPLQPAMSTA